MIVKVLIYVHFDNYLKNVKGTFFINKGVLLFYNSKIQN